MNTNKLLENKSAEPYGYTFYLVQNQQEPTPTAVSVLRPNQVTNIEHQIPKDSLRTYYENSGVVENHMVTMKTPQLVSDVQQQQINYDTKIIKYVTLPNYGTKTVQQKKKVLASRNLMPSSHSFNLSSIPNVTKNNNPASQNILSMKQVFKPSNLAPNKLTQKVKTKSSRTSASDHTSVCLLKVGNAYHSVSNLNEHQTKLVTQALQNISDPEKGPLKPTFDAATNTRVVYKIISPNDLKVITKNKVEIDETMNKARKEKVNNAAPDNESSNITTTPQIETIKKITRSGRAVKSPKYIQPANDESPKRRKKPSLNIKCFQCSSEFRGVYQLQRHYEKYPTHIPGKVHTNLFHCLLAILKSSNSCDKTNAFIQQLEILIGKLKSLFPCLLHRTDETAGKLCTINEDLGRLLGINPGKYNLNMDAIHCNKDGYGYCKHNPQKTATFIKTADPSKPSQVWLSKHKEETANNDAQSEDCARTNSIDKWPTINKRKWKIKSSNVNINDCNKLVSDNTDHVDLCEENEEQIKDKTSESQDTQRESLMNQSISEKNLDKDVTENLNHNTCEVLNIYSYQNSDTESDPSNTPVKFHSAHFNIRSSPIKPTSNVFNKIQIRPKIMPKFDIKRPVFTVNISDEDMDTEHAVDQSIDLPIFKELNTCNTNIDNTLDSIEIRCKETSSNNTINYNNKEWNNTSNISGLNDNYTSNDYIEPSMMHIQKPVDNCSVPSNDELQRSDQDMNEKSCLQGPSVLHLLDTLGNDCLNFGDSELRNNSIDLPLDLFPFNNN